MVLKTPKRVGDLSFNLILIVDITTYVTLTGNLFLNKFILTTTYLEM
jgi:hypothetical protein